MKTIKADVNAMLTFGVPCHITEHKALSSVATNVYCGFERSQKKITPRKSLQQCVGDKYRNCAISPISLPRFLSKPYAIPSLPTPHVALAIVDSGIIGVWRAISHMGKIFSKSFDREIPDSKRSCFQIINTHPLVTPDSLMQTRCRALLLAQMFFVGIDSVAFGRQFFNLADYFHRNVSVLRLSIFPGWQKNLHKLGLPRRLGINQVHDLHNLEPWAIWVVGRARVHTKMGFQNKVILPKDFLVIDPGDCRRKLCTA